MNNGALDADIKYHLYILRLWRAETADLSWRASLENPRTGERLGFENLEGLFAFLMEQAERDAHVKQGGKDGNLITSQGSA